MQNTKSCMYLGYLCGAWGKNRHPRREFEITSRASKELKKDWKSKAPEELSYLWWYEKVWHCSFALVFMNPYYVFVCFFLVCGHLSRNLSPFQQEQGNPLSPEIRSYIGGNSGSYPCSWGDMKSQSVCMWHFMGCSCAGSILGNWSGDPRKGGRSYKPLRVCD